MTDLCYNSIMALPQRTKEEKREYDKVYIAKNRVKRYAYSREHYQRNKEAIAARHKRYRDKWRAAAIEHLGSRCVKCGYDDNPLAFQIDHVNGGGQKDRADRTMTFLKRVILDTTGKYQLLCANCNQIKKIENGEHRWRKTT